jgi:NDMA-dependent alcohol dehydrogenase
MKTRAAVLWDVGQEWSVEEIDLDPPREGEVLLKMKAAGLCHSDEHMVTGDMAMPRELLQDHGMEQFPLVGGHEGSAIVVEVGPGVRSVKSGDHVSTSFVPSCGVCRYCASGHQNLCDLGAGALQKGQISDGTVRHHSRGVDLCLYAKLGTFSEYTVVSEQSVVQVDADLPFEAVALVSCGVATGWGSAVQRAGTRPGDTVVVIGTGGVGMNAVQGARMAGARRVVAVDPAAFKREKALEFGATEVAATIDQACELVRRATHGRMAERVILTPSVMLGELLAGAMTLTAKGGTCVVTAVAPITQTSTSLNLFELAMWEKEIKGTIFGSLNPRVDIPRLLGLYRDGQLKLDELVTRTYPLDQINEGYQDMRDGRNIRGVILFN